MVVQIEALLKRSWPDDFINYPETAQGSLALMTALSRDKSLSDASRVIAGLPLKVALRNCGCSEDQDKQLAWTMRLASRWRALKQDLANEASLL